MGEEPAPQETVRLLQGARQGPGKGKGRPGAGASQAPQHLDPRCLRGVVREGDQGQREGDQAAATCLQSELWRQTQVHPSVPGPRLASLPPGSCYM